MRVTQSDRLCVTKRERSESELSEWGKREGAKTKVGRFLGVLHKVIAHGPPKWFGTPRPQPLPLSQAPVHKVTEWRTIQKYHFGGLSGII